MRAMIWMATLALAWPAAMAQAEESSDASSGKSASSKGAKRDGDTSSDGSADAAERSAADKAAAKTDAAAEAVEEAPVEEAPVEEAATAVETAPPPATEPSAEPAPAEAAAAKPKPDFDLVAEAGAIWLAGNTQSINANGKLLFGVQVARNKFGLEFGGAYGVANTSGTKLPVSDWDENAKRVYGGLRYDRFLTDFNSIYIAGGAFHDPFAGFDVRARGDVGYSHKIVDTDKHKLKAEAGFNYTFDDYVLGVDPNVQHFVGGRLFAGYGLNINGNFGLTQTVEALLGGTENKDPGPGGFDGRLVSETGLTGTISKIISVKLGFQLIYDFVPPTGFRALDTTTSAAIVATLM